MRQLITTLTYRIKEMARKETDSLPRLSPREEMIMTYFWSHGPLFVRQIIEMMPEPKLHFNTVSTFVRSLEAKGWLGHEQFGNTYRYFPLHQADEYRKKSVGGLVERFFGRSYINFVSALVRDEKISTDELKQLIEQIESQKDKER